MRARNSRQSNAITLPTSNMVASSPAACNCLSKSSAKARRQKSSTLATPMPPSFIWYPRVTSRANVGASIRSTLFSCSAGLGPGSSFTACLASSAPSKGSLASLDPSCASPSGPSLAPPRASALGSSAAALPFGTSLGALALSSPSASPWAPPWGPIASVAASTGSSLAGTLATALASSASFAPSGGPPLAPSAGPPLTASALAFSFFRTGAFTAPFATSTGGGPSRRTSKRAPLKVVLTQPKSGPSPTIFL
mmetsp:Transcript_67305/g.217292  ORF Transcript_67305/g.217292 Transcript_67305/m.217292 type:complete len:252 (+) Transcript_67305:2240-2995(+)